MQSVLAAGRALAPLGLAGVEAVVPVDVAGGGHGAADLSPVFPPFRPVFL